MLDKLPVSGIKRAVFTLRLFYVADLRLKINGIPAAAGKADGQRPFSFGVCHA
jgi:hypothetical protein